jgi:hypothetical protein
VMKKNIAAAGKIEIYFAMIAALSLALKKL